VICVSKTPDLLPGFRAKRSVPISRTIIGSTLLR
jgi:hypothetical protein